MNVRLLRRIAAAIQKEPRRFLMSEWIYENDWLPPCHTSACIAGHALLLSSKKPRAKKRPTFRRLGAQLANKFRGRMSGLDCGIAYEAARVLKLTRKESWRLFSVSEWPVRFMIDESDRGSKAYATKAVERIEHFIATKGAE